MTAETMILSGYDDRKELLAQRYHRAGKSLFVVALPIYLIQTHMPIPDPDQAFEGNRTVSVSRATAFGQYWRENVKWATPPLLLDTTYPLSEEFELKATVAGVDFGVLRLPYNSETELQILDGQHRILGWTLTARRVSEELKRAREGLLNAEKRGNPADIDFARRAVDELRAQQARLRDEYVTVEILEGVTLEDHKQYFHDIATNAKGITKSITASFDRRNAVNRVAMDVAQTHELLVDKVDGETDAVRGQNPHWISNKNLTDVVTVLALGTGTSMTAPRKKLMKDEHLETVASAFFTALADEFGDLRRLADGELTPKELRSKSLLGSPTILRALAGAYHAIAIDDATMGSPRLVPNGDARMRKLFGQLSDQMGLPISDEWFATGLFDLRTSQAPGSKTQELKELAQRVTTWARLGEPFATPA
jgi:hypothetical protein